MSLRPHARRGGFTLVEVVFAASVLAIAALMLSAALSSSERMTSLARERAIANNVLRAYIERMRQQYPVSANDGNMIELLNRGMVGVNAGSNFTDGSAVPDSTPIYDLQKLYASGFVERGALNSVVANVYMVTDETGASWGPAVTATISNPTAVASINTGTDTITTADATSLGLPRDLNANGVVGDTNTITLNSTNNVVLVPMKVKLSWVSGSSRSVNSTTPNQSLSMYAIFSPQH